MAKKPVDRLNQSDANGIGTGPYTHGCVGECEVLLYPAIAYAHPKKDCCRILVQGRVFHQAPLPLTKRLILRGLKHSMEVTDEVMQSQVVQERTNGFLVAPESGHRPVFDIGGHTMSLRRRSKKSGLFFGKLDVSREIVKSVGLELGSSAGKQFQIGCSFLDGAVRAEGNVHYIAPRGVSIITDIDDTIKQTRVTSRRQMLAHTFLLPFEPVPGMSEIYRSWEQAGCQLHYVSSSPWQLYPSLRNWMIEAQFPMGSMHLKWFRLRDEMFKRWRIIRKKSAKATVMVNFFKKFPQRRFVLIGDSGERDPEIYAKLAGRFGSQVHAVLVRELEDRPLNAMRIEKLKQGLNGVPFGIFRDASELKAFKLPNPE